MRAIKQWLDILRFLALGPLGGFVLVMIVIAFSLRGCANSCRSRGGTAIVDYAGSKVLCMEPPSSVTSKPDRTATP